MNNACQALLLSPNQKREWMNIFLSLCAPKWPEWNDVSWILERFGRLHWIWSLAPCSRESTHTHTHSVASQTVWREESNNCWIRIFINNRSGYLREEDRTVYPRGGRGAIALPWSSLIVIHLLLRNAELILGRNLNPLSIPEFSLIYLTS